MKDAIFQIKIDLIDSEPLIWRRIQVMPNISLLRLHEVLQITMGWVDYHLHQFTIGDKTYILPGEDPLPNEVDERRQHLGDLVYEPGSTFLYEYDFGDRWEHMLTLERQVEPDSRLDYPICIDGEMACPPEDCGGPWRYNDTRKAYLDAEHPLHDQLVEWLGYNFNPESFDANSVNRRLRWEVKAV